MISKSRLIYLAAALTGAFVLVSLVLYTADVYVFNEGLIDVVKSYAWLPYVAGVVTCVLFVGAARRVGAPSVYYVLAAIFCLAFFTMSLETLRINAMDGSIRESWPWGEKYVGSISVSDRGQYCYERKPLLIELKPVKKGRPIAISTGLWPASFSDSAIAQGFLGWVHRC